MTPEFETELLLRITTLEKVQHDLIAIVRTAKVGLRVLLWIGGIALAAPAGVLALWEIVRRLGGNGG